MAKDTTDTDKENSLPASIKKFRQSPEIEGFYRFIYENDLRVESHEVLTKISLRRKEEKKNAKKKK